MSFRDFVCTYKYFSGVLEVNILEVAHSQMLFKSTRFNNSVYFWTSGKCQSLKGGCACVLACARERERESLTCVFMFKRGIGKKNEKNFNKIFVFFTGSLSAGLSLLMHILIFSNIFILCTSVQDLWSLSQFFSVNENNCDVSQAGCMILWTKTYLRQDNL